jgi:exopolysaccharide biosynthesis polyprenyl glycosylphosphotransferase
MLNRRRHGLRVFAYFLAESLVVAGANVAAYAIRRTTDASWAQSLGPPREYLWLLPASVAAWGAISWILNTYEGFRGRSLQMHAFTAALTSVLGTLVLFAVVAIFKRAEHVNRSLIGLLGVTAFVALLSTRMVALGFLVYYTQKGYDRHYVLIGGTQTDGLALAETLEDERGGVFQVQGFVSENPADAGRDVGRWKVLGGFQDIPAIAVKMPVDEVYLLPTSGPLEANLELIRNCEAMGMSIHLRLAAFEKTISRLELQESAGGDYLRFTTEPRSSTALFAKRMLDVVGAALMLFLLSPLLLLVALLVKLTSRGPAVFRQERAGMNGRIFTLYKFRTMVEGAEKDRAKLESKNEMEGPVFKIKEDPRITGLGKFLRKTSIDELPQLWNVVQGDMSLVGPRPLPTYEVEKFEPWQRRRMSMRPGITCLWQISGRNKVTTFVEWMRLDLEYVDRWSLGLDLKILLRTIPAVLGGRGAY